MKNSEIKTQQPNPNQLTEQLTDAIWRITETWNEYAKAVIATPLMRAVDDIGLQLALTQGRSTVRQHLQHISNARKALVPANYYLQRATLRGLIEPDKAEQLHAQMTTLARRLDMHSQAIVQATNKRISEQKPQEAKKAKSAQKSDEPRAEKTETSSTH